MLTGRGGRIFGRIGFVGARVQAFHHGFIIGVKKEGNRIPVTFVVGRFIVSQDPVKGGLVNAVGPDFQ